jgi:hypothetical protein
LEELGQKKEKKKEYRGSLDCLIFQLIDKQFSKVVLTYLKRTTKNERIFLGVFEFKN